MNSAPFGKLLREYRLAHGLSQESLAERAAMSVNGISALERGANQTPQRKTLELLVKALSLNAEQARALKQAAMRPSRPRFSSGGGTLDDFPHPITPFFGRHELLSSVERSIIELPLVTLTGPGGIGKTRLGIKAVEEVATRFAGGVRFIDLAAVRDPDAVPLGKLVDELRSKNALLLVDNCEHVAPAVASAVQTLIQNCPELRIITTSRQPLGVPGEQIFRVPSLELDASVELFIERARRAIGPAEFSPEDKDRVARIVTRLDGIALAIELAAARMKLLTLAQLEQNLTERFHLLSGGSAAALPRQQAMRATMDWSYELLHAREREVFDRLGVFPGSFSLDAAVAVCGDEHTGKWQIFEALASLVDKSLVNSAPEGSIQRYRLLETTRAYVTERMNDPRERTLLQRGHAAYYCSLAQNAAAALESTDSTTAWAYALEQDLENFRAALDWTLQERGDMAAGVRLLLDLQEFWIVEGIAAETERRAKDVLLLNVDLPPALRAALWLTIARMRQEMFGHPERTLEAASNARELYERIGDRSGVALAVRQQAAAHMRLGDLGRARDEFQQSLEIYTELGDRRMASRGLGYLASLLQIQGEYAAAQAMLLDVLRIARSSGDDRMIPTIVMNLAETEFALGQNASAAERARENLSNEVLQKSGDMIATQEANLSVYLLALGRTEEARAMAVASLEDATPAFIAVPLQHLAASIARSDAISAAKILGYVEAAFKAAGFSREHTERFSYGYLIAALQEELDAVALAEFRRDGATMTEQEILGIACRASARLPSGRLE